MFFDDQNLSSICNAPYLVFTQKQCFVIFIVCFGFFCLELRNNFKQIQFLSPQNLMFGNGKKSLLLSISHLIFLLLVSGNSHNSAFGPHLLFTKHLLLSHNNYIFENQEIIRPLEQMCLLFENKIFNAIKSIWYISYS